MRQTLTYDRGTEIAERLNNRPRKVLDFLTPNEVFAQLVADAQSTAKQCCASA
jgi:IS30 family transposase